MDYGNTNITGMHLYPQRRNVPAQVAEELKTVIYAMEERRKKIVFMPKIEEEKIDTQSSSEPTKRLTERVG